jgi:hypothetical protein
MYSNCNSTFPLNEKVVYHEVKKFPSQTFSCSAELDSGSVAKERKCFPIKSKLAVGTIQPSIHMSPSDSRSGSEAVEA